MQRRLYVTLMILCCNVAIADDWPQWLGPQRESTWREQNIVSEFPEDGLKVTWRAPVGLGYAGPAVANGKVYVFDYVKSEGEIANSPSTKGKLKGQERLQCFSAKNGKALWEFKYDQPYDISYPAGPRCTPTVDSGKVYTLGAEGELCCLDANSGEKVWSKNLNSTYQTTSPFWGHSAHPLIDGDFLYCVVGGKGSVAVCFNKNTGEEVWKALSAKDQGYCPPTMIEHSGVKQLLIWHPESLNSLNPKTGEVFWSFDIKPNYSMSVTAPRKLGDLLFVSGIGHQGALLKLDSEKPAVTEVWKGDAKSAVYSCNTTPYLVDGMIYGCDCQTGEMIGADLKDGKRLWKTTEPTNPEVRRPGHGTAFIVKHDNGYFLFSETGDLILANLSAKGYEEVSRAKILKPTNEAFGRKVVWSHPAFAEQCIFARNDEEIVCVSLAK